MFRAKFLRLKLAYTEAKVNVTQEVEQRAQWSAPAWAACCALCSISCVTFTLASVYTYGSSSLPHFLH